MRGNALAIRMNIVSSSDQCASNRDVHDRRIINGGDEIRVILRVEFAEDAMHVAAVRDRVNVDRLDVAQ